MTAGKETHMRGLAGRVGGTALVLLAAASGAAAQERPGAVYVLGGVTVSHQDGAASGDSQIYITAPGGTTAGWTIGGGLFVARHLSIEGEWSWSGMMTAREPSRYGMTYVEERRDRVLGVMVRIHTRPAGRIDIEPVAGVAAVAHDRWSTTETNRPWLPPDQAVEVGPRIRYDTVTEAAFAGGVDVRIGSGRVAVVPGFRVRAATRGEDLMAYYPGGFPRWSIGGGVCVRVAF
jgi:hypothetical protein